MHSHQSCDYDELENNSNNLIENIQPNLPQKPPPTECEDESSTEFQPLQSPYVHPQPQSIVEIFTIVGPRKSRVLEQEWSSQESNLPSTSSKFLHVTDVISLAKVLSDGNVNNSLTLFSTATNRIKNDSHLLCNENTIDSLVLNNSN